MQKIFNTILTLTVLAVSSFGLMSSSITAQAQGTGTSKQTGIIQLTINKYASPTPQAMNHNLDTGYQSYDCVSGPTILHGVDVSFIKNQCAGALDTWNGQVLYATVSHYDSYYGKDQMMYGFYDGANWSNFQSGSPAQSQWFEYEPNFNKVYVISTEYICNSVDCSEVRNIIADWTPQDCSQTTAGNFTAEEFRAICNRSVNQGQYYAFKGSTTGRNPNVSFVGTAVLSNGQWSWVNPITGQPANWI